MVFRCSEAVKQLCMGLAPLHTSVGADGGAGGKEIPGLVLKIVAALLVRQPSPVRPSIG